MTVMHIRTKNNYVYGFLSRSCLLVKYYNIPIIYALTMYMYMALNSFTCTCTCGLYIHVHVHIHCTSH